jgi:hypothetical protein
MNASFLLLALSKVCLFAPRPFWAGATLFAEFLELGLFNVSKNVRASPSNSEKFFSRRPPRPFFPKCSQVAHKQLFTGHSSSSVLLLPFFKVFIRFFVMPGSDPASRKQALHAVWRDIPEQKNSSHAISKSDHLLFILCLYPKTKNVGDSVLSPLSSF